MKKTFVPITESQIQTYAEASGDHNPIHLDAKFAQTAGFPNVIAHGMLSMGLIGEALAEEGIGIDQMRSFSVKFKDVVPLGSTLTYASTRDATNPSKIEILLTSEDGREICTGTVVTK